MSDRERLDYTVTFLQMTARPSRGRWHPPIDHIALLHAEAPPVHFFRYLYKSVGAAYEWTDLDALPDHELAAFVQSPQASLYVAYLQGWPAGFALLDFREAHTCDLAYFGMVPEAAGLGLGKWLLLEMIYSAWDRDIERMTVNTCTLDHPAALPLYQQCGFEPVRREERSRIASASR